MTKVTAIIFDCFGVLVSESWLSFKQEFFGHDSNLAQEATNLLRQADAGLLSHDDFVAKVAGMANMSTKEVTNYLDRNLPNAELFDYIKQLKPKYKIGLLSNAAADWLQELFSKEQLALFDAKTLSFESGMTKPAEGAYASIAERLGVASEACVFIDDQERHCTGAREAGMQAIWYQDFAQMKRELEKLLLTSA